MSGLIVGLIVGVVLYFLDKEYSKKVWCTQEIKSFNYSNYNKKDLNILIDTCEDEVDKYNLLEELLYDYNNTNKFSSIINELYVNGKIKHDLIMGLDKKIGHYLSNPNYNYNNVYANSRNNLPILEKIISKYLQFTKNIIYTAYTKKQQERYYQILLYIFKNKTLIENTIIQEYMLYDSSEEYFTRGELKIDTNLMYIQEICKQIGKTSSNIQVDTESKDIVDKTLIHLFNSYKSIDNKKNLLEDLRQLTSRILAIKKLVGKIPDDAYFEKVSKLFYYARLYPLILDELSSYTLENEILIGIFNDYVKINKILTSFIADGNIINKLIFRLFNRDIGVTDSKIILYNKLMITSYKKGATTIDNQLIYFFGINNNDILKKLLKIKTLPIDFKKAILHSIVIRKKVTFYYGYGDSINIIKKILSEEKNFNNKNLLMRDILLFKSNDELINISLNYIEKNEDYYINELNEEAYDANKFHFYSIFSYMGQTKPNKKSLRLRILNMFFHVFQKTSNTDNKIYLLSSIQIFLGKNDISSKIKLKKLIEKERNREAREVMLLKFNL